MLNIVDDIENYDCESCGLNAEEDGARTFCGELLSICDNCFDEHMSTCNACAAEVARCMDH